MGENRGFTRFDSEGAHGASPMGWEHVRGGDWEVYTESRPYRAKLFHEELLMEVVSARTQFGLARKIRSANRKHGIAQ